MAVDTDIINKCRDCLIILGDVPTITAAKRNGVFPKHNISDYEKKAEGFHDHCSNTSNIELKAAYNEYLGLLPNALKSIKGLNNINFTENNSTPISDLIKTLQSTSKAMNRLGELIAKEKPVMNDDAWNYTNDVRVKLDNLMESILQPSQSSNKGRG